MHSESGFWRIVDGNRIEIAMAHAMGLTEISEGSITVEEKYNQHLMI